MDVDITEAGELEHPGGDDASVGDDDNGFGGEAFEGGAEVRVVFEAIGLEDGEAEGEGSLLDRGEAELELATGGAVGLGEDEGDFMVGVDQGLEAGNGEFGGAAEDEFHECSV